MEERKVYGVEGDAESLVYYRKRVVSVKDRDVLDPSLDFYLSRSSFELGIDEDLFIELASSQELEDVMIEFSEVGIQPLRFERFSGRVLVPVRLRFKKEGVQEIVVKVSCTYLGKRLSKEKKFAVEVRKSSEKFFKDYKILGLVGSGGFADVYRVVDRSGRVLALKVYRGDNRAFISEIGKVVHLVEKLGNTPYIVSIVDYGVQPAPYIVMEYYPANLRIFIENPILNASPIDRLKIMLKISKVMTYAVSIGVHHGDLKPENILVRDDQGRYYPVVADWGGGFTPCYSAPEVYRSGHKMVTEKSDVWSFGVILYEIYTQKRLFKDEADYMKQIERDIRVELKDKKLEDIINKCLCIDPKSRPSFREIVKELRDYISIDLGSRVSRDPLDYLLEKASIYAEKGDIDGVEEMLKKSREIISLDGSMGAIFSTVAIIFNKMAKVFYLLSEERVLNVDEIKPLYEDIFEQVGEELKARLKEDKYTVGILPLLEYHKIITSTEKGILRMWTDRLREIIFEYYIMKIKQAKR